MTARLLARLVCWLLLSTPAAAFDCAQHFAGGSPPILGRESLSRKSRELCFEGFGLLHSGVARGPIYAAEHLTRAGLQAPRPDRLNAFHAEDRLPASERAELGDYARSGYDRGHMAPSGDMPSSHAQHESFSLSNMVPQAGPLNRGLWAAIEEEVRRRAIASGGLFVVTGPLFEGETVEALKGRVLVPSHIWKATLDPATGETWAVIVRNVADAEAEPVTLDELEARAGLTLFPSRSVPAL